MLRGPDAVGPWPYALALIPAVDGTVDGAVNNGIRLIERWGIRNRVRAWIVPC